MKRPANLAHFRREAVRVFKAANPQVDTVTIVWEESVRVARWADGSSGYRGTFRASVDGYSQVMRATWCGGLMVR